MIDKDQNPAVVGTEHKLLPTNDQSIIVKEIEQLIDKDQNPAVVGTEHKLLPTNDKSIINCYLLMINQL